MRRRIVVLLCLTATTLLAACTASTRQAAPPPRPSADPVTSSSAPAPSSTVPLTTPDLPRRTTATAPRTTPTHPAPSSSAPTTRATTPAATTHPRATPRSSPRSSPRATTHATSSRLPLGYPTGDATQVVTVTAGATSDTQATLQAWQRAGSGWRRVGPSIGAFLGTAGMTSTPSEQTSATPMGSFTLTEAFGHDANPGTRLPYRRTTPADWWISQSGPLYNTLQHCSANCSFAQGDPNEHLYYETPYYDYAMVIDYNRSPVRQGAGSAFFVHVSVGAPTAGCVSIPKDRLVTLMRWLRPAEHPRILIGTG